MLSSNGTSGFTCLVPELEGKAPNILELSMTDTSCVHLGMLRKLPPITSLLRTFITKGVPKFINIFSHLLR